jgi:hypothetical protein
LSDNVIRISYARATFAAELLAGCRSSLLRVTDLLDFELDAAQIARRRSSVGGAPIETVDKSQLVAAALYAEWIADALHRQIVFYVELDQRLAGTFDAPQLPLAEAPPQAPPEWPQPPLPEPLCDVPHPLADMEDATGGSSPRDRIAAQMLEILEDIDDAIQAINYSRNVRFQAQIADAAVKLREWVAASATTLAGGRRPDTPSGSADVGNR